jgi:hypothetical protein
MFCNSTAYGPGCPYSPHKKHVHISNGQNCIYCGSSAIGLGCPQNPFSKMHVRGVEYNMMTKESVYQSVMAALFLERLTQPFTEMPAFKLGVIDANGRRLKECVTDEEKSSFTLLDQHVIKIRRIIGEDVIELFKSKVLLEMSSKQEQFDVEKYQQEVELSAKIDYVIESLGEIFTEGVERGFSRGAIENLVIDAILKKYEDAENYNG